ncbi:hypothetical protein BN14_11960 [Rhizoctonia solani AG-1 IB]|uniref:Tf2-1-like SH3-like domain-containing protein n=1 Tax=Thanatephorus cucumeris (strain AG1-IB / isolate 7/3/14) TaxID=1108050 RepID=M5CEX9_THACB|nr:hypothetical protein BN14_11960 [Rhizoctonia solani AG-1 IB]
MHANKGRRPAPFTQGDLVFVSTKNMSVPEGKSRKLVNKYIGPLEIEEVVVEGTTYRVKLPDELKRRGIKSAFHASLLKPHIPSEDNRFPRHDYQQFVGLAGDEDQWSVEKITNHQGKGNRATFEVLWHGGEITWEPYKAIKHLQALRQYFEAQGITRASQLPLRDGFVISDTEDSNSEDDGDESRNTGEKFLSENLRVNSARVLKDEHKGELDAPFIQVQLSTSLLYVLYKLCLTAAHPLTTCDSATTEITAVAHSRPYSSLICTTLRPVRSTHKPLSITRKPLAFSADKDVVLDADVDAEIPTDKAEATNLLPIETNHPSPMIPVLGQEEALRFLGMHLNDLQDWAAPGGVANHPNEDPNANAPESAPPIARSPIQVSPTNLPPTEPASAVPPEPPINHQLLRDLGYHADQLVDWMGETMQAVDTILQSARDLEILLGRTHARVNHLEATLDSLSLETMMSPPSSPPIHPTSSTHTKKPGDSPKNSTTVSDSDSEPDLELKPSDLRLGSATSRFIDSLWRIINYERSKMQANEPQSRLLPPPRPSKETYRKVATIARLADSLFPSRSNTSSSGTPRCKTPDHVPQHRIPTPEFDPHPSSSLTQSEPRSKPTRTPSWEELKYKARKLIGKGKGRATESVFLMETTESEEERDKESDRE